MVVVSFRGMTFKRSSMGACIKRINEQKQIYCEERLLGWYVVVGGLPVVVDDGGKCKCMCFNI